MGRVSSKHRLKACATKANLLNGMITVVAALIQQNRRLLICQRRKSDTLPLQWEFPGGKVKPGESPTEALARELEEELGLARGGTVIGREVYRTRHRYAELAGELELIFFAAALSANSAASPLRNLAFERIEWAEPAALCQFDFLPADGELVRLLASGALRVP